MAIDPAAISASPAVTIIPFPFASTAVAPVSPAASANGTVSPSDIPITMSRTASVAVKCFSTCSTDGIFSSFVPGKILAQPARIALHAPRRASVPRAHQLARPAPQEFQPPVPHPAPGAYNYGAGTQLQEI